jgi:outer membrane protein assembly factor BamA
MLALGRRAAPRAAFDLLVIALVALLLPGCLLRARRGEQPLVGSVGFEGNRAIGSDELGAKIALTSSGRRIIFEIGSAFTFEPGGLVADRERILRLYRAHGYYGAAVTNVRTQEDNGRVNVTFVISEGPPTHVAEFVIQGLEKLPPKLREQFDVDFRKRLPIKSGDVFAEVPYEQSKATILEDLRSRGFMSAKVDGIVDVFPEKASANVQITAEPGLEYHVGPIRIDGILGPAGHPDVSFDRTRDATGLRVGDLVTPQALNQARAGVAGLGVYASAELRVDYPPDKPTPNIVLALKEAPFQTIETGAGLEADQTRQLARASVLYTNKNLGGGLQKIIAGGSLGWAFLPSVFQRQEQGLIADLRAQYIQPRIYRTSIDAQFRVDYTKDLLPAFLFQRVGARAGLLMYLDRISGLSDSVNSKLKGLTFAPSINYEYYFNVGPSIPNGSSVGARASPLAVSGCGPDAGGNLSPRCLLAYVEGTLNYDLRDNPLAPRKGMFFSFDAQYAGLPGSDFKYARFSPEGRVYIPITHRFTFAARVRYGVLMDLDPNKRVPPGIAHFFAGGANSVRAAGSQLLGPLTYSVLDNGDFPKKSGNPYIAGTPIPLGGDHLLEGSVELRWFTPLENLSVAVFFDAGRVWTTNPDDPGSNGSALNAQYGPGFGLRYNTPLGPVRFDLAFRRSAYAIKPANVDLSALDRTRTPLAPLPSTNAADYTVALDCPSSSPHPEQCYSAARINFYITIGEAF